MVLASSVGYHGVCIDVVVRFQFTLWCLAPVASLRVWPRQRASMIDTCPGVLLLRSLRRLRLLFPACESACEWSCDPVVPCIRLHLNSTLQVSREHCNLAVLSLGAGGTPTARSWLISDNDKVLAECDFIAVTVPGRPRASFGEL